MELQDMIDLLHIYDATEEMKELKNRLLGIQLAQGDDGSLIGEFKKVGDIIMRNSPIFDPCEDFETQRLGQVINDRTMPYEDRAKIILGINQSGGNVESEGKAEGFHALGQYLANMGQDYVTLSFEQIKEILGFELPNSAYKYNAWWGNGSHNRSKGWMDYGYKTYKVKPQSCNINFKKADAQTPSSNHAPRLRKESVNVNKSSKTKPVISDSKTIKVCGYDFTFLQEIKPERNAMGKVIEYSPQGNYSNPQGKPLHKYGSGTFCKFSIKADNCPGVYLWVVENEIMYIGETKKLAQRFNDGYGVIEGINCYLGGQITNCKMNKVVLELSKIGKTVKLYFFNTNNYKQVELELLNAINTQYNVKDN